VNARDSLLAALVASIWGFNFVVIDWGMHGVPPLLFAAVRFAAVLVPAVLLVPRPDAPWRVVATVGVFMSLGQFGFLYVAMAAGLPPGLAALVLQAQVIFTVAIAAVALRERPTGAQILGVALGSLGLTVVALGRGGHVTVTALVLCLLGALSWGIGNVVSRASGISGGLSLTVWSAVVVPLPLLALSLLLDGPGAVASAVTAFSWQAVVSTLYTAGLASLVGYGIFNTLLSRNPSSAVVPWVLLAPVVAMASAWLLLDQRPNAAEAGGGVLLIVGVLVALRPVPGRRARRLAERGPAGLQPRDRHPEGRAGHVVEPDLVEEVDRGGVAAVLAADAQVQVGPRGPATLDGRAHQGAHTLDVQRLER
jgi:O-acetylserine/cysteine efflux transporter